MLTMNQEGPTVRGLYINGEWVSAARSFDSLNPSSQTLYARIPDGTPSDVAAAAQAAHAAFPAWATRPFHERAHILLKIADVWERRKDDFVKATVLISTSVILRLLRSSRSVPLLQ